MRVNGWPTTQADRAQEIDGQSGEARAQNATEPTHDPARAVNSAPEHLDALGREEWNRVTPELLAIGILTQIDRAALAAYCMAWSRWVEAETNLRKTGTLIKTPSGYPIQNPYLAIANAAIDTMRKFLTEFGMTPSSRSRIHAAPPPDPGAVDPWEELDTPQPKAKVQ